MSLVRKFTTRARTQARGEETSLPRSCTVKYNPGTISRAKISLPTELLSTTNVQALNAPNIRVVSGASDTTSSSSNSVHSDDFSSIGTSFLTADNGSSTDLSPITPLTPFSDVGLGLSTETKDFFSSKSLAAAEPVPALPQRAPSHSKKAHVELSRQRSFIRSMSPPPTDIAADTRDSLAIFSHSQLRPSSRDTHPFGRELAKVDEVAETFGGMSMILDDEEQEMAAKGLRKFSVSDYLAEITGQTGGIYEDCVRLNPWI